MNFIINNQESVLVFKKRTFYAGIKIFNSLPSSVTVLKNDKTKFKAALKKYLKYTLLLLNRWIFHV